MKNCREADQNELHFRDMCGQCAVRDRSEKRRSEQNRALFQSGDRRDFPGRIPIPSGEGADRFKCACTSSSKIWGFLL